MADKRALAIILGGGRGTRLFPLTRLRAKPAVPLAARYRLIDIPISNCINSGINRIFVLTQFLSASLHRHVHDTYKFDNFSQGFVDLLPAEQTLHSESWYQGTADAVRRQLHRVIARDPDEVLILAGDHLYRTDYSEFLELHRQEGADVTIGVLPVARDDASRFGILKTSREGHITRFEEKPSDPAQLDELESRPGTEQPFLGSMGIYIFKASSLRRLLDEVQGEDFGKQVIPTAIRSMHVHAWRFDGYWEDIGTIEAFFQANLRLTRPDRPFSFYDRRSPIYTRPRFLPGSLVDGSTIQHTLVGDGCRIYDSQLDECVVGQRSIVRRGCRLHKVVMLGADWYEHAQEREENWQQRRPHLGIGEDSVIERAIIDKNARIGREVQISSHQGQPDGDFGQWFVRDGVVVIPKNAVIDEGTVIAPLGNAG